MQSPPPHPVPKLTRERWFERLTRGWREPGDVTAVLDHLAAVAREVFGADLCVIYPINPITRRSVREPGVAGELLEPGRSCLDRPRNDGLAQRVIDDGYAAVEDPTVLDEKDQGFCRCQKVESFAAVAFHTVTHHKPFAVLYVDYRRAVGLDEAFEKQLRHFSQLASRELQLTWFFRRYQLVGEVGQEISRSFLHEADLFEALQRKVRHVIDTTYCLLFAVYRPENHTLDVFSHVDGSLVVDEGRAVDASLERFLAGDLDEPEAWPVSLPWQSRSAVHVPLSNEGRPLGILSVQHPEPDVYDGEDRHLLELVGHQVSLALSNLRLYGHLSRLHEVGKNLTRDLESKTVLQTVVDRIRETTGCDLVILYSSVAATPGYELPPVCSGELRQGDIHRPRYLEAGGIVDRVLHLEKPLFADDARELYRSAEDPSGGRPDHFQEREGIRSVAALPLRFGDGADDAVGVLFVNYRTRQRFGADSALRQLIQGLAAYAAIAIKNAREFGAERRRHVKTLESLRDLDRKLSQHPDDLDQLLEVILDIAWQRLSDRVAPDEASILLHDPFWDELVTRAAMGPHSKRSRGQVLRLGEGRGITLEVFRTGEPLLVPDVRDPEWKDRFVDVGGDTRCEMDVPLKDGDKVLGVINLESREPRAFDDTDLQLMKTLAGQAVLAVKIAQAYEQEMRLRKDEHTLINIAKKLTQQLDFKKLWDAILLDAIENTRAKAGTLVQVDEKSGDLIVVAEHGVPKSEIGRRWSREKGILGLVAREGEFVNADLTDPKWQRIHVPEPPGMKSEIAVPLKKEGQVVGVLNIESPKLRFFGQRNEMMLEGLADLAVIALQNAERFASSERRLQRFEVLFTSQELARITARDQLGDAFKSVVELASRLWDCEVVIRRLEPEGFRLVESTGKSIPRPYEVIALDDPLAGKVYKECRTVYVPDALNPPPEVGVFPRSNDRDRSFIVTPIAVESLYYGNLALSHLEADHFRPPDVRLVKGLAQQLAVALHRIEEIEAHQKAEKRAFEAEKMGEVGRQAYELLHRQGNDLGLVRTSVRKIRRALEATGGVDDEIEAELSKIHTSVSLVLSVGKKLAHELSGDRYGEPKDRRGNPRVYPVRALLQHGIDILALDEDMQQKIRIKLAVPQDSLAVKVDYGQFADALLNLLMNAVHAMMPDGGSLMVGAQRRADEVEIWVQDTGHGISPRHLAISSTSALPRKREAPASVSGASRRRSSTAAG